MVSLHGGHSGEFCEHAAGTLRETLEAAAAAGFAVYGVSEHAPRFDERHLYASEIEKGYDIDRLSREFERYAVESVSLARQMKGRLEVLRAFEAEVVPSGAYARRMMRLRDLHGFDYMVGSVHWIDDFPIDGPRELFERAVESSGGLEALVVRYYRLVAEMVDRLRPEVVAHLDLLRLNAPSEESLRTPAGERAARQALEAVRQHGAILDLNTAGLRKGLGRPYPSPWLVRAAHRMGIPFCFGDDSHGPEQVGYGLSEGRLYLIDCGVREVTCLHPSQGCLSRFSIHL